MKWSFPCNSFVKLSFVKVDLLITWSIPVDPNYSVIKGLQT